MQLIIGQPHSEILMFLRSEDLDHIWELVKYWSGETYHWCSPWHYWLWNIHIFRICCFLLSEAALLAECVNTFKQDSLFLPIIIQQQTTKRLSVFQIMSFLNKCLQCMCYRRLEIHGWKCNLIEARRHDCLVSSASCEINNEEGLVLLPSCNWETSCLLVFLHLIVSCFINNRLLRNPFLRPPLTPSSAVFSGFFDTNQTSPFFYSYA